jgi:valine--pyruvate aminotransferase
MSTSLSNFGLKLSGPAGITELMKDLGEALSVSRDVRMLGGGNPAHIPEVQAVWRRRMRELMDDGAELDRVLANYDPPQGSPSFIDAVVQCFNSRYGWGLRPGNVAITNGSQNSFFYLLNMLGGDAPGGHRRVLLPLCPEYIGYADQGIGPDLFTSAPPRLELIGDHSFKYRIDFDRLPWSDQVAAVCASRPTNPTGNVLTDEEVTHLSGQARERGVPWILDNAYGAPFPDIIFTAAQPRWDENTVLSFSLSKLGLPGLRTGIVVAREDLIQALASMNAVVSLANGNLGQAIVEPLLRSGELLTLSRDVIRPFYERKSKQAQAWLHEALAGSGVPYRVHKSEGALFLWLWFKDLPITSAELYRRLKARKVLVIPGHYFFFGQAEAGRHRDECLRLTFSQADRVVQEGVSIIADEVRRAYAGA